MEVYERLDEFAELVEGARRVPMSDSCLLPRSVALELIESIRESLPASLRDAATILADRDDVLEDARRESESRVSSAQDAADEILAVAENEAGGIVAQARADAEATLAQAQNQADSLLQQAQREAERRVAADTIRVEADIQAQSVRATAEAEGSRIRAEADIYVDKRLAGLEDTLRAALDQIGRGRRRVGAPGPTASQAAPGAAAPQPDPADEMGIYDFEQDPGVADDLGRNRGRSRR